MRRQISAVLVALLALGSIAAAAPGDVNATLSPPEGQTAVKVDDKLFFGGEVPPGSEPEGRLDALGAGNAVLESYDVSGRVTNTAGSVSGSVTVTCFYVPGCLSATNETERDAAFDALVGYRLTLTVGTISDDSLRVDFDDEPPIILGYELVSPTTVRVLFSEDVFDPEGDSRFDWEVEGDPTAVTSVDGTGDSRTLTLRFPQDRDATPEVRYAPVPSPNPNIPNIPYVDGARNELDAANRFSEAADRIAPPVPTISSVDGEQVTYESDDVAIPILGSNPSPIVIVDDVPSGSTAQLFLDDGDGRFDPDTGDVLVGTGPGTPGGTTSITVDRSLSDAVHRFYVRSIDDAACDPNDASSDTCPNRSGRSDEARYDLETVLPVPVGPALARSSTITLLFSEPLTGADAAGQWAVSNPDGGAVTVDGVTGSGATRTLQFTGGPIVPSDSTVVVYTPPASDAYADEHGNEMDGFTLRIEAAELPVLEVTSPEPVTESDPPTGLLQPDAPTLDYTLTLSDDLPQGADVTIAFTTVQGGEGAATGADDDTGDYRNRSGEVTITGQDGPEQAVVRITVTRDLLDEFDEDVLLQVRNVDDAAPQFVLPGDQTTLTSTATIEDDDPLVVVRIADVSRSVPVGEGRSAQVTVDLGPDAGTVSGKPVTISWATDLDGSATASDVDDQSGTVTIPAGASSATFDIATNDDTEDEPDERFSVRLSGPVNADLGESRAVLTIQDDDIPVPTLTVEGGEVSEQAPTLPLSSPPQVPFTFRLSTAPEQAIEVGWATGDTGSATPDVDFEAASGTVRFAAGETEKQVLLTVSDDDLDEDDETVALDVVEPAGADLEGGAPELTVLGTILDDDALSVVGFADDSVQRVVEEGATSVFTVRLDRVAGRDVQVDWSAVFDGAATTADVHSDDRSGTVTISAGDDTGTFSVRTTQDSVAEPDEALSIQLSDPVNVEVDPDRSRARLVIADDEIVLPTITVTPGTGSEDPGLLPPLTSPTPVTFTFELSETAERDVRFDVRTGSGGTATAESDFRARSRTTLTIPAGSTSTTVDVTVLQDALDEFDESVELLVSNPSGARLQGRLDQLASLGTIEDDDPLAQVGIADVTVGEGDLATLEVTLDTPSGKTIEVDHSTADSSAQAGEDYAQTTGSVTFEPGETSATITVPTRDDAVDEPDEETFEVRLSIADPDTAAFSRRTAVVTITDDDLPVDPNAPPVVSLSAASVDEGDPATLPLTPNPVLSFQVLLSRQPSSPVEVTFETVAGTAVAGDGGDFVARSGTVTIPTDSDRATVEVEVRPDLVDEFDEELALRITSVTNATLPNGQPLQRAGRILDDDPLATVAFDPDTADVGVAEGGDVTLRVELTGPTQKQVTVDWATSFDGDATTADAPAQSGRVTLPAGATSASFVVATLTDSVDEPNESFSVVLSDPANAELRSPQVAAITLVDGTLPVLRVDGASVEEGAPFPVPFPAPGLRPQLTWELSLSSTTDEDVTVDFTTTDAGEAVAGTDYTARSGRVTIEAGQRTATVSVDVLGDELDEFDEDVVLRLSAPVGASFGTAGTRLEEPAAIVDDDPLVTVGLGQDVEVDEGNPVTVQVGLDAVSGKDVVVRVDPAGGDATRGSDHSFEGRTVTIRAGETSAAVTVRTIDDGLDEADETLRLRLTLVEDDRAVLGRDTATVTILDDDVTSDVPVLQLTGDAAGEGDPLPGGVAAASLTGGTLEFVIGLSKTLSQDVVVSYRTLDVTATAGEDYDPASGDVTIPAGSREVVVQVGIIADSVDEDDEEFLFRLTAVRGGARLPDGGLERTGLIIDEDPLPRLRIGDDAVVEGETAELVVSLDRASGRDVAVLWSVREGSAGRDDVATSGGSVVFPAGTTSRTITIATVADGAAEGVEQLEVVLRSPVNASIDDGAGTLTVVDVGAPPVVSVQSAAEREGDSGSRIVRVPVTLTSPSTTDTTVTWTSQRLTAAPDDDYRAPGGKVVIPAGATSAQIAVTFLGDTEVESDEDFLLVLTEADTFIAGPLGRVTIVDDDGPDSGNGPGDGDGDGDGDGSGGDGSGGDGSGGDGDGAGGAGDGSDDGDDGATGGDRDGLGAPDAGDGELPATGGGAALLGVLAVAGAAALRRRRRDEE